MLRRAKEHSSRSASSCKGALLASSVSLSPRAMNALVSGPHSGTLQSNDSFAGSVGSTPPSKRNDTTPSQAQSAALLPPNATPQLLRRLSRQHSSLQTLKHGRAEYVEQEAEERSARRSDWVRTSAGSDGQPCRLASGTGKCDRLGATASPAGWQTGRQSTISFGTDGCTQAPCRLWLAGRTGWQDGRVHSSAVHAVAGRTDR